MENQSKTLDELLQLAKKVVIEADLDAQKNPTSEDIQVVIVEPEKKPYKKTIKNDLESLQAIVGGYIEILPIGKTGTGATLNLTLNEEGKLQKLPFNRIVIGKRSEMLVGTFFISAFNKQGDNISLTDQQCDKLIKKFSTVEVML